MALLELTTVAISGEQSYLKEWLNGGIEKHFLEQVGTQEEGSGYRG